MDKRIAIDNLLHIKDIFPNMFLVYGTALGSIREKDILTHDLDTDIGIFNTDFSYNKLDVLRDHGFIIRNIFGMINYGCEISVMRNGIKTDIMFFYKNDTGYWNALWDNVCVNGEKDIIKHQVSGFNFIESELQGNKFKCPNEDYLVEVYGKDWKTPIIKWDWRTDHHNRI